MTLAGTILRDRAVVLTHGRAVTGPDGLGGLGDPGVVGGELVAAPAAQAPAQSVLDVQVGIVGVRRRGGVDGLLGDVLRAILAGEAFVLGIGMRRRIRHGVDVPARSAG